ncbi:MAG: ATP-binding protein [Saprospiraceae bacterium]|nr:ATP-binding protein [Saprospiraceae bacterium]
MFYPRDILPALESHLANKQVTVLTGMRRTGKTTLLKHLMEKSGIRQRAFFDLERIDYRELFSEKNYETIVYALNQRGLDLSEKTLIGIDEIQLAPNLPSVVKYLYDHYGIKFILTGSSSYYLKNRFEESLAGRKKIFEIYPLSFGEMLTFQGVAYSTMEEEFKPLPFIASEYERIKPYYNDFIDFGGFPEVVLMKKKEDKRDMIADILSSYINYDVAVLTDFSKSEEVYQLIKLLAIRVGARMDISKICSVTGMSRRTVENYLSLLEQSYLIQTIPVISRSPDREIVKAHKLYFLDNGIASMSAELSSGSKFENAIFNQLRRFGDVAYYSLKTGNEIDFILNIKMAIEVKETATEAHLKNTINLAKNIGIEQSYVVGRYPHQVFDGFIWGGVIR